MSEYVLRHKRFLKSQELNDFLKEKNLTKQEVYKVQTCTLYNTCTGAFIEVWYWESKEIEEDD